MIFYKLGGVKEIKLLGREKNFFSLHYFYTAAANHYQVLFNFVNTLPRLFFEILTLLGVTGLVISMMYQNKPKDLTFKETSFCSKLSL